MGYNGYLRFYFKDNKKFLGDEWYDLVYILWWLFLFLCGKDLKSIGCCNCLIRYDDFLD